MNPPFLFLKRQKEKRAVHGPKRKTLGRIKSTCLCRFDRKTGVAAVGAAENCWLVPGASSIGGTENPAAAAGTSGVLSGWLTNGTAPTSAIP